MLGTRRSSVTVAAGARGRKPGLINYSRGDVQIIDRPKMEEAACEC